MDELFQAVVNIILSHTTQTDETANFPITETLLQARIEDAVNLTSKIFWVIEKIMLDKQEEKCYNEHETEESEENKQ